MAKLKGPLFSLGATQQIGKTLVYFPWKGLNVAREYVVPTNPNTAPQQTQRAYITAAVAAIHEAQAHATQPLREIDTVAYALWASVVRAATTWFNQAVKNWIDLGVAGLTSQVYRFGGTIPGANQLQVGITPHVVGEAAGAFWYGTSKTALINSQAGALAAGRWTATIAGLTSGVKYFWQWRPSAPAAFVGSRSGIYHGTPT